MELEREETPLVILLMVLLMLICLQGCMTIEVHDSILIGSTVSMDKPIRAGVSTTGEAIGEAIKAAGYGGIDVGEVKSILEEIRKIRAQRLKESPL